MATMYIPQSCVELLASHIFVGMQLRTPYILHAVIMIFKLMVLSTLWNKIRVCSIKGVRLINLAILMKFTKSLQKITATYNYGN